MLEWERVQLYFQLDGWNRMLGSAIGVVERRLGMCLIVLFLVFCIVIGALKSFIFVVFYLPFLWSCSSLNQISPYGFLT